MRSRREWRYCQNRGASSRVDAVASYLVRLAICYIQATQAPADGQEAGQPKAGLLWMRTEIVGSLRQLSVGGTRSS